MNRGLKIISEVVGVGVILLIMWATVSSWLPQTAIPAGMDIESIVTQVNQYCTGGQINSKGTCNSLLQKLQGAIEARDRGQPEVACNKLNAFSNEVQAQSGKKIDPAAAQVLIDMVTPLCSPAPTVTATAMVISPLPTPTPPKTQTILFTAGGAKGQELYKMAIDNEGNRIGEVESLNFSAEIIRGLYPSPDNKRVAIWENYGDGGGTRVYLLDTIAQQTMPLFKDQPGRELTAGFLAWSADSHNVLVIGGSGSDLGGSAWLVDSNTSIYHDIDIKQEFENPTIMSAIFSLDDSSVIYAQSKCFACGSQIMRLDFNTTTKTQLFENPTYRIENMALSPDGNYIAFNQWSEYDQNGELYLMKPDGTETQMISHAMTDYYDTYAPLWTKDGKKIIFFQQEETITKSLQIYAHDSASHQKIQLTHLLNQSPLKISLSPDGSKLIFLTSSNEGIKAWVLRLSDNTFFQLGGTLQSTNDLPVPLTQLNTLSTLIWLP